jgi:uncharacterized membrane protein
MEGDQQSSKGSATGVGVVCAVVGAIIGAVGVHMLQKKQSEAAMHSQYVTIQELIVQLFMRCLTEMLGVFASLHFIAVFSTNMSR